MNTLYVSPQIDRSKEPIEPGTYWAREISYDLANQMILSWPSRYEVVAGVPNPRKHRLLVKTGLQRPHHRALNCYSWGEPTKKERELFHQLSTQR